MVKINPNLIKQSAITLESSATGTISGPVRIPINKIRTQIGSEITANTSNNRVIIGNDVNHVRVCAQVQGAISNANVIIDLRKNGTTIKRSYMPTGDSYQTLSILPFIESVTAADYFELYLAEGTLNVSGGLSNATLCYLTVEKID